MFHSFKLNSRLAAATFGALAIGAVALSTSAAAAPLPLFPFLMTPPIEAAPPPEMIARQPYLPRQMAGGPGNPLGARAMYLGGTIYRIHGTNAPGTIGTRVSSGCIRLTNEDVADLYSRVNVGTKVIVLPMTDRRADLGSTIR